MEQPPSPSTHPPLLPPALTVSSHDVLTPACVAIPVLLVLPLPPLLPAQVGVGHNAVVSEDKFHLLPFGLEMSPHVFARLVKAVVGQVHFSVIRMMPDMSVQCLIGFGLDSLIGGFFPTG